MSVRARVCHTEDEEREMRNKSRIERDPSSTSRRLVYIQRLSTRTEKLSKGC